MCVLKRISTALQRVPDRSRFVLSIVLYGLAASTVAVASQVAINWIYRAAFVYPSVAHLALVPVDQPRRHLVLFP